MLLGNLGKDPELKSTPSGAAVCNFSLATGENFKDKDGHWQERAEWHNIVVWNKQAEVAAKFLKKGSRVLLRGSIKTRNWEKDGQKHYMTEIVVSDFWMMDGKKDAPTDDDNPTFPSDTKPLFEGQTKSSGEDLPF